MRRLSQHSRTIACGLAAGCAAAGATGCQSGAKTDERADFRDAWQRPASGAIARPQSVVVAQGPSPLVFQARQSGMIHVTDLTSGQELASGPVTPGTLVWVNEDKGVFVNDGRIRPGPLPAGHSYGIVIDIDQDNSWRSGVQAPRPPRSTSRPGQPAGR